jgi:hypothetical protein
MLAGGLPSAGHCSTPVCGRTLVIALSARSESAMPRQSVTWHENLKCTQVVDDPSQADIILAHGTEALAQPGGGSRDMSLYEMQVLLQQCAQQQGRQLPMVVANPDLVRHANAF